MPNWCDNLLEVCGETNDIKSFLDICDIPENCQCDVEFFSKFSPMPEGSDEDGSWYNWSVENWGTKWDACEISLNVCDSNERAGTLLAMFSFFTAWSPPEAFVKNISKRFPRLLFKLSYSEPGCSFSGVLMVNGDDVIYEYCNEYEPGIEEAFSKIMDK